MRRIPLFLALLLFVSSVPRQAMAERPASGDPAPSFTVPYLQSGEFDLGQYLGKEAILLDFWSIYCVSCMQEMPKLIDIYERYKDEGLVCVGVNLDSFGIKRVVRFVKGLDYEIPFPLVSDKRRAVAKAYGVSVLPATVVIDREGKVIYYHVGYAPGDEAEIEEKVREALGGEP